MLTGEKKIVDVEVYVDLECKYLLECFGKRWQNSDAAIVVDILWI